MTVPEACSRCLIQMSKCQVKEKVVREGHSSFVLDLAEDRTLQVECGLILSCLASFTSTGNESLEVSALVWN